MNSIIPDLKIPDFGPPRQASAPRSAPRKAPAKKGRYYCRKCMSYHKTDSAIGRRHKSSGAGGKTAPRAPTPARSGGGPMGGQPLLTKAEKAALKRGAVKAGKGLRRAGGAARKGAKGAARRTTAQGRLKALQQKERKELDKELRKAEKKSDKAEAKAELARLKAARKARRG